MIQKGSGRGEINSEGYLKVLLPTGKGSSEGVFIRVTKMLSRKEVVGVLANMPFERSKYKMGDLVLAKETNPKHLAKIVKKVGINFSSKPKSLMNALP